jgi:Skp family chaperone for outer membrane proteins
VEKAEKKKGFEAKLLGLRSFELSFQDAKSRKENELQVFFAQSNKRIVEDVMEATRSVGEREGFNLILNASKSSPESSDVLFTREVEDVTERILALLNAGKPAGK